MYNNNLFNICRTVSWWDKMCSAYLMTFIIVFSSFVEKWCKNIWLAHIGASKLWLWNTPFNIHISFFQIFNLYRNNNKDPVSIIYPLLHSSPSWIFDVGLKFIWIFENSCSLVLNSGYSEYLCVLYVFSQMVGLEGNIQKKPA